MAMKAPNHLRRKSAGYWSSTDADGRNGIFDLPALVPGRPLLVQASDGLGWEHVSVSIFRQPHRAPTWAEMCHAKGFFWDDEDVVVQYHPAKSQHINFHQGCLHLWRPSTGMHPIPDPVLVGPKAVDQ